MSHLRAAAKRMDEGKYEMHDITLSVASPDAEIKK